MLVRDRSIRRRRWPCPHPFTLAVLGCVVGMLGLGLMVGVNVRRPPAPTVQAAPAPPPASWQHGGVGNPFTWRPVTPDPPPAVVVDTAHVAVAHIVPAPAPAKPSRHAVSADPPAARPVPVVPTVVQLVAVLPAPIASTVNMVADAATPVADAVGDVDDTAGQAVDTVTGVAEGAPDPTTAVPPTTLPDYRAWASLVQHETSPGTAWRIGYPAIPGAHHDRH